MRLSTLAVLAPLAALAAADTMTVFVFCTIGSCNYMDGRWTTAFGTYYVDSRAGCHDPPYVPGLRELCTDWSHARAHFYFDNQPKRCLALQEWNNDPSCSGDSSCYVAVWNEVACTW